MFNNLPYKAICVYNGSQASVADVFHEAVGAILEGKFGPMLSTPRNIYTWLTQPILDPANSGRVTMDSLMKGVPTALEWSFEAKAPNVRAETLEKVAELWILRFKSHDKRKTRTPNTNQRWTRREMSWEVVGGEST